MGSGTALKPNLSLSEGQRVGQGGRGKEIRQCSYLRTVCSKSLELHLSPSVAGMCW